MQNLIKNTITLLLCLSSSLVYAESNRKFEVPEERSFATDYKSYEINKTEHAVKSIETELFGKQTYSMVFEIAGTERGIHYSQFFYKIDDDNICLGLRNFNSIQDEAVIYVNTKKECGTKCKVFLDKPEDKRVFYIWEPLKTIIPNKTKDKLVLKTDKGTYSIILRTGIEKLEITAINLPKIESIEGLENFPYLINLSFIGFDY